ncbi:hypothetical protein B0H14DRAFT_3451655 [Mycena olivaceomarginata]|nr:hypothetical protein B0H14DRAFT_3451655 [Mycena olivaceomarginata]
MDGSFSEADALASTRLQAVKYFDGTGPFLGSLLLFSVKLELVFLVVAIVILVSRYGQVHREFHPIMVSQVFEYCLTFNLEVSLIWPSRWSLTKILYLLSRSYKLRKAQPHVDLNPTVSIEYCAQINTAIAAGNVFGIAIAEAIFVLRTYALSGRQRTVLITFGTLYSVFLVATVSMMTIFLRNMIYSPPLPHVPGCNLTGGPFILVGLSFILVLLNETALMSYTLWIGVKTYRHSTSPLVTTLYRDGVTYYVFLFLGSAANVAILIGAPKQLRELLNTPLRVLHSVLSTRTLLHVRKAERERSERTVDTHTTSAGSVHFANDLTIMSRG